MMVASLQSESLRRPRDSCGQRDDLLYDAALTLLQSSGYAVLRNLRLEVTDAVVVIHGVLPTYYLKQMAQTILQRLDGIHRVTNLAEVRDRW
jgi:BON domain